MKIISKFVDYYDSAGAYGIEEDIIYLRHPKEIDLGPCRIAGYCYDLDLTITEKRKQIRVGYLRMGVLGFCGQMWPVFSMHDDRFHRYTPTECRMPGWGYDVSHIEAYFEKDGNVPTGAVQETKLRYEWFGPRVGLDQYLHRREKIIQTDPFLQKIFLEHQTPIFTISERCKEHLSRCILTTNPLLREVEAYRKIDPFTAYQDIMMYISGVLGTQAPETVDVSDVSMRDKKGFDEWSFKRLPTKRKNKK